MRGIWNYGILGGKEPDNHRIVALRHMNLIVACVLFL